MSLPHLYLFKETIELSYYTIYCLVIVYPIVYGLIHYFISRAASAKSSSSTDQTEPAQSDSSNNVTWTQSLGSIAGFLILALAAFRVNYSSRRNVYDILDVHRQDSIYTIAKKYVSFKGAFQSGKIIEADMNTMYCTKNKRNSSMILGGLKPVKCHRMIPVRMHCLV